MKPVVLDEIPCRLDADGLAGKLRVRGGGRQARRFAALIEEAGRIARPRAVYRAVGYRTGRDRVEIAGVVFESRLLVENLEKECQAFPFLATCGSELEEWSASRSGTLERFWAESVKETVLELALAACTRHIDENHRPGPLSMMNPGSLEDWPLSEQAKVFEVLGEPAGAIEVRLTESALMVPLKSLSGILFPSREGFINCRHCPREGCPSRRADYQS